MKQQNNLTKSNEKESDKLKAKNKLNIADIGEENFSDNTNEQLFRLKIKNGEYIYARPKDIVLIESCDHFIKVHIALDNEVKTAMRHNTLRDFLPLMPYNLFIRLGRFCAINVQRISGGNFNKQIFEFDYRLTIKLKHSLSYQTFISIGK